MALTVTVTMPPEQGDAVLDTLLTLYQALAEALQLSTLTYLDDQRSLGPVLERRDELVEVEALIDLLGWSFGRVDPVELTGAPGLVRETVYATLVDAAERFAQDIDRYEHGEIELERVQEQASACAVLFSAFMRLERSGP